MIEIVGLITLIGYVIYTSKQKENKRCKAITDFSKQCDNDLKNKLDELGVSNEDRIRQGLGKYVNK